jgi:mRNA interferase RelE/StbE
VAYTVLVKPAAERDLKALPRDLQRRIMQVLEGLEHHPHPPGAKKLTGLDLYRVRVGAYRVVYLLSTKTEQVLIVKIGHRGHVYREL